MIRQFSNNTFLNVFWLTKWPFNEPKCFTVSHLLTFVKVVISKPPMLLHTGCLHALLPGKTQLPRRRLTLLLLYFSLFLCYLGGDSDEHQGNPNKEQLDSILPRRIDLASASPVLVAIARTEQTEQ